MARWYEQCLICLQYRGQAMRPPMRSIQADDCLCIVLPWCDCILDMQGPFTRAEGGELYVMSYHCTRLKVPKLAVCKLLQTGFFSRALAEVVCKTRRVPDIIRSDRGPEIVNRTNAEFMAICGIKHVTGASLTPRPQGMRERGHQTMMKNHLILMNKVCEAFPQEWPSLLPALEYLYATAPQGPHGLSAHDIECGHALAASVDKQLAPFTVPKGLP